ncbi:hypothetical protein Pla110_44440 [Polystyrenella longa]|uniref:Uncharacterized protein n=1 Tax=Polystyrenella longa TaxID=2528007 RepID=A0A518CTX2_9PLAN|nr:hypothetical protein [Polystyrenella longa]QDU82683.1 hypothetical protein Pla110_44440 [Polystyrenella longa]
MPVLNSLGPFQFYRFHSTASEFGSPEKLHAHKEFIQVPGFNGTATRLLGIKGKPFEMVSEVDCGSLGQAAELYGLYTQLEAQGTQSLVWRNIDYSYFNVRYEVIEVLNPDIQPLRNKVGGLLGGQSHCYYLRSMWRLVPIAIN